VWDRRSLVIGGYRGTGLVGTGRKILLSVLVNLGGFTRLVGFGIFPRTKNAHLLN